MDSPGPVTLSLDKCAVVRPQQQRPTRTISRRILHVGLVCIALLCLFTTQYSPALAPVIPDHCASLGPIGAAEFSSRRNALARTLVQLNASAYMAEPGTNTLFYANISSSNWHLSERPLLLIITPQHVGDDVEAKVTILTPAFEAPRAKLLPISSEDVNFVPWEEAASPYQHAVSFLDETGPIFVDGNMRNFIVDGLRAARPQFTVSSAPYEIKRLRERKSPAEIELLKCVNEATVLSIRAVQKQLYFGIHESTAGAMMRETMKAAGVDGGCLTLFGENAALPHGAGTDRILGKTDFALFDCTPRLHGYEGDVTRTIALPDSQIPPDHLRIWYDVHSAQTAAIRTARAGVVAAEVDKAARASLNNSEYFTHRLGHGIGMDGHEEPYLNGGSKSVIETGHTFSDEPGIYIVGKVGVRLEDCFYIDEDGSAVFLTAGVGGQAESPWQP